VGLATKTPDASDWPRLHRVFGIRCPESRHGEQVSQRLTAGERSGWNDSARYRTGGGRVARRRCGRLWFRPDAPRRRASRTRTRAASPSLIFGCRGGSGAMSEPCHGAPRSEVHLHRQYRWGALAGSCHPRQSEWEAGLSRAGSCPDQTGVRAVRVVAPVAAGHGRLWPQSCAGHRTGWRKQLSSGLRGWIEKVGTCASCRCPGECFDRGAHLEVAESAGDHETDDNRPDCWVSPVPAPDIERFSNQLAHGHALSAPKVGSRRLASSFRFRTPARTGRPVLDRRVLALPGRS
jgi:hypothetical protein